LHNRARALKSDQNASAGFIPLSGRSVLSDVSIFRHGSLLMMAILLSVPSAGRSFCFLKYLSELPFAVEKSRHHRANGYPHDGGHLSVRQIVRKAELQSQAVLWR
jgi:hypothetical protein